MTGSVGHASGTLPLSRRRATPDGVTAERRPRVVLLSSSLLTDRMLLFSDLLADLQREADTTVWATSAAEAEHQAGWRTAPVAVEPLPALRPYKEFPYNYLRRLNEFVWDFRHRPPSRLSARRHIWNKSQAWHVQALKLPARGLAWLRLEEPLEAWLERVLLSYPRSPEAERRLRAAPPDVLVTTGPYRFDEPAIVAAAKNAGVPVLALITSWDNVSTKNRMVFGYDGYLVWSEQMRRELHQFYPRSRDVPVHIIGAPQFDVFFQERFQQSREAFCAGQGLDPTRPVVVYALGSPNFIREHYGALQMAELVRDGGMGDVQLLVRPHPLFDNGAEAAQLRQFGPRVVVQRTGRAGAALTQRSQSETQICEWVNTFRHADVVVNLSSTVTIDAALCDNPVVNLDYDPEPGRPNQALIKDANHLWTHFKPIAESGGLWLTNDFAETVEAVRTYLRQPALHRERRRWMVERVCGAVDGRAGARMAAAIADVAGSVRRHAQTVGAAR